MSHVIFELLPFRIFYFHNECTFCTRFHVSERPLSGFGNKKMVLSSSFFPGAFTEMISLENDVPLFEHYHHIIYSSRDKYFENNYGNFGVIYYESVNSSFMVYKFYLEMICRVIVNNVIKKHFTNIVV